MAKKNIIHERVEDESQTLPRVDPRELVQALGAEELTTISAAKSPFSMWALRSRLLSDVVSTGGRPARRDASLRKVPVTDAEWAALDEIAALLKQQGVNTTPGQVAGVLLHQSLAQVLRRLDRLTPATDSDAASVNVMTNADLEEMLESVLAAAANAELHLEELRPVALELLRQMRDDDGAGGHDK
jgi:hypothetical protein